MAAAAPTASSPAPQPIIPAPTDTSASPPPFPLPRAPPPGAPPPSPRSPTPSAPPPSARSPPPTPPRTFAPPPTPRTLPPVSPPLTPLPSPPVPALSPSHTPPPSTAPSAARPPRSSAPAPTTHADASPSPAVVPSAPSHRKPLPTPATAADPAHAKTSSSGKSSSPSPASPSAGAGGSGVIIAIGVVVAVLVISLIAAALLYTNKRRRKRVTNGYRAGFMSPTSPFSSQQPSGGSSVEPSVQTNYSAGTPRLQACVSDISMGNSRFFTYEELYQATDGFSVQKLLGEGGFGSVYKGCLPDGKEVAVKQLKDGGGQGEREFQAEVDIISRVHHRHLVSLVGYCIASNQRLLVYDFVSNNTLHFHLHGHGRPVLEWSARIKIAAGAARGIAYLHEDCHPRIIHRDIKSSNILLDDNFEAKVADFGLARLALDAVTHVTTRVMGTFGYMAPEYASSGKLTERSDVFSFGVVLLEIITGRRPVDALRSPGNESLVEWARPLLSRALDTGYLDGLLDPRLEKNFNEVEMFRMIEAAAACIRHSASRRPRMSQVVRVLDSLADIDLTNGVQPGQSELFNVANAAEIRMFQRMVAGVQDDSSDLSQYSWSSQSRGAESFCSRRRSGTRASTSSATAPAVPVVLLRFPYPSSVSRACSRPLSSPASAAPRLSSPSRQSRSPRRVARVPRPRRPRRFRLPTSSSSSNSVPLQRVGWPAFPRHRVFLQSKAFSFPASFSGPSSAAPRDFCLEHVRGSSTASPILRRCFRGGVSRALRRFGSRL